MFSRGTSIQSECRVVVARDGGGEEWRVMSMGMEFLQGEEMGRRPEGRIFDSCDGCTTS